MRRFQSNSASDLKAKHSEMLLKQFSLGIGTEKVVKSINNHGFKINNINVKGPAIILDKHLYLWNVPQFGVGGPSGDVEPIAKGSPSKLISR